MKSGKYWIILFSSLLLLAFVLLFLKYSRLGEHIFYSQATFAGSEKCLKCHEKEYRKWKMSPHYHQTEAEKLKGRGPTLVRINKPEAPACESCHGPASRHIEWALDEDQQNNPHLKGELMGFGVKLSAFNTSWTMDSLQGSVYAEKKYFPEFASGLCGRCHSNWLRIAENS